MIRKHTIKLLTLIIVFMLAAGVLTPAAVSAYDGKTGNDTEAVTTLLSERIQEIIDWKMGSFTGSFSDYVNSILVEDAGTSPADWYAYVCASVSPEVCGGEYCEKLYDILNEGGASTVIDRQRIMLVYIRLGGTKELPGISEVIGTAVYDKGIMSLIYGIMVANEAGYTTEAKEMSAELLKLRLSDSGWALTGSISDIDVTAMAIRALAGNQEMQQDDSVQEALAMLSSRMLATGDYMSWGNRNCESGAQVILALCALGTDVPGVNNTGTAFVKDGVTLVDGIENYRCSGGGYSHLTEGRAQEYTSVQVLQAYVDVLIYIQGAAEIQPGEDDAGNTDAGSADGTASTDGKDTGGNADGAGSTDAAGGADTGSSLGKKITGQAIKIIILCVLGALTILGLIMLAVKRKFVLSNVLVFAAVMLTLTVFTALSRIETVSEYFEDRGQITEENESALKVTISIVSEVDDAGRTKAQASELYVIAADTELELKSGSTVLDALLEAAYQTGIIVDYTKLGGAYVKGIDNLYEMEYGALSGWLYSVNGIQPGVAASQYELQPGDIIEWIYKIEY